MKKYIGTKTVWASLISMVEKNPNAASGGTEFYVRAECGRGEYLRNVDPDTQSHELMGRYLVVYEDGYISTSPADVFEKHYREIDTNTKFDWGDAQSYMDAGFKVARHGWNGKGLYAFKITKWTAQTPDGVPDDALRNFYALKDVHSSIGPWVPSMSDLLATDWTII